MSILISHLSYTYGNRASPTPALVDVSTEFKPGEVTLIAGASGCGKTTLLRCVNGLIPHSYASGVFSGAVTLFGQPNAGLPIARISQLVGTVLQDPERQIVASEVINEIAFGLENLGIPRDEMLERIHAVARLLRIEPLLERETFRLSGGEKQKVALAGVLAMRPRALLLDEPLASLDPASGREALQLMRELAGGGIAMVIIEHRVEDVLAIQPEHCIYMSAGRVTYDGDAPGLLESVDWREIKLPAPVVIRRVRGDGRRWTDPSATLRAGDERRTFASIQVRTPANEQRPGVADTAQIVNRQSSIVNPLIEFRGVHYQYKDGPEILHDVSFAIRPGDRIALLGPNGAGKTTLVKHAVGLHKPTRGQVLLEGRDSRSFSVAQAARAVGFVFQSPSHMLFAPTVREELSFGPRNIGLDAATIAYNVTRALDAVNLPGIEDTSPLSLSFGQQKRISIASILTMRPRVLVMDQPSAGQDYASYTHFMNDIVRVDGWDRETNDERRMTEVVNHQFDALLFITHDLDLAVTYANRVLLLADGRLVADGAPQEVLADRTLLERCRLRPTSLLEANLAALPRTSRFLPAPELVEYV